MPKEEISFRHATWRSGGGKYNYPLYACDAQMLLDYPQEEIGWCYVVRELVFGEWMDVTPWVGVFPTFAEAATEAESFL